MCWRRTSCWWRSGFRRRWRARSSTSRRCATGRGGASRWGTWRRPSSRTAGTTARGAGGEIGRGAGRGRGEISGGGGYLKKKKKREGVRDLAIRSAKNKELNVNELHEILNTNLIATL